MIAITAPVAIHIITMFLISFPISSVEPGHNNERSRLAKANLI